MNDAMQHGVTLCQMARSMPCLVQGGAQGDGGGVGAARDGPWVRGRSRLGLGLDFRVLLELLLRLELG